MANIADTDIATVAAEPLAAITTSKHKAEVVARHFFARQDPAARAFDNDLFSAGLTRGLLTSLACHKGHAAFAPDLVADFAECDLTIRTIRTVVFITLFAAKKIEIANRTRL
jgi:hypothetical protein